MYSFCLLWQNWGANITYYMGNKSKNLRFTPGGHAVYSKYVVTLSLHQQCRTLPIITRLILDTLLDGLQYFCKKLKQKCKTMR